MAVQFGFAGCGLAVMGVILAVAGILSIQPALRSLRWHGVEGAIFFTEGGDGPRLRYRYSAGGRQFSGSRVAFHGQPALDRYKNGQPVTVYYDPAAPDRSVLEPGPGLLGYLPLGLGGLFFVLGLILGMMAYVVY